MLLEKVFIIVGALFVISYILGKTFLFKLNDTERVSHYVALIATFLGAYVLCALAMLFTSHSVYFKSAMMFFAVSPFILGQLADYHTEKIYSGIQVLIVIISIIMCFVYV